MTTLMSHGRVSARRKNSSGPSMGVPWSKTVSLREPARGMEFQGLAVGLAAHVVRPGADLAPGVELDDLARELALRIARLAKQGPQRAEALVVSRTASPSR